MNTLFKTLLSASFTAALCFAPTLVQAQDRLPVVASFSILGDLVRVVGGNKVAVVNLVGPDEDAHIFEPKPQDAKNILQSKLLVTNGLGFEPWAQKLVKSAGYTGQVVVASQGVTPRMMPQANGSSAEVDPHAWQDPTLVMVYVRNIAAALTRIDPTNAAIYQSNSTAYIQELQAADTAAKAEFDGIAALQRKVITSHDAFGYFGARYGVRFLAPRGLSTQAEPSAKQVARFIRQIQQEKIKAVFVENMSNPKLLSQLSKDVGVKTGGTLYVDALSNASGPASTYLKLIRHNVALLAAGMRNN